MPDTPRRREPSASLARSESNGVQKKDMVKKTGGAKKKPYDGVIVKTIKGPWIKKGGVEVKLEAVGLDPVAPNPWLQNCMVACVLLSFYWTYILAVDFLPAGGADKDVPNYILASFPIFFFLIAMEWIMYKLGAAPESSGGWPNSPDAWSSVAAGLVQQATATLYKRLVPFAVVYANIHNDYKLIDLEDNWVTLAVAFVVCDFSYYWLHRQAHVYHFLWAGHATHHSSEYYNMWTALRQSWWQGFTGPLWTIPLAFVLPPRCQLVMAQWVTLYQFWIHTCTIRRLPAPIEYIFSTPSAHRVHHDRRVHKNFAGVFILWDRLFGTFQDELQHSATEGGLWHAGDETCYFGIKEQIGSWTEPILQYQRWQAIFKRLTFSNIFKGPGFVSIVIPRPLPINSPATVKRLRTPTTHATAAMVWLWGNLFVSLFMLVEILLAGDKRSNTEHCITSLFAIFTLTMGGLFLDAKDTRMAMLLELVRNGLLAGSSYTKFPLLKPTEAAFGVAGINVAMVLLLGNKLMGTPQKKMLKGE